MQEAIHGPANRERRIPDVPYFWPLVPELQETIPVTGLLNVASNDRRLRREAKSNPEGWE
jgi:hypothetical protein